jgi:hypothetical protein
VDYSYFDQLVLAGYSCANPASYVQSDPNYVEQINYMICADTPSLRNYVKSTGGSDPDFTGPWAPGMHALMGVVSDAGLGGVCNTCLGPAPAGKVYVMWTTPNATTYHILNHCTCCMTPPGI